jgi:hypothetical protein
VLSDPRLAQWTEEATADRIEAGEEPLHAEIHGYADAIAALKLVRRTEAHTRT